jgi:hypothetical protein
MSKYVILVNLIFIQCSNELASWKFDSKTHFSLVKDTLILNLSILFSNGVQPLALWHFKSKFINKGLSILRTDFRYLRLSSSQSWPLHALLSSLRSLWKFQYSLHITSERPISIRRKQRYLTKILKGILITNDSRTIKMWKFT